MEREQVFTHTDRELLPILDELRQYEPIFHSPDFGSSNAEFELRMAPDYWEVGASGRRYDRDFILRQFDGEPAAYADALGWQSWDHAVRRLGPGTYLMTYVLRQGDRVTRRATIWQEGLNGWIILYHQGTVVSIDEEDRVPLLRGSSEESPTATSP